MGKNSITNDGTKPVQVKQEQKLKNENSNKLNRAGDTHILNLSSKLIFPILSLKCVFNANPFLFLFSVCLF